MSIIRTLKNKVYKDSYNSKDMLKQVIDMFRWEKQEEEDKLIVSPKHIAITMEGTINYADASKTPIKEAFGKSFAVLTNILRFQVNSNIPIVSIGIVSENLVLTEEKKEALIETLIEYLELIAEDEYITKHKIRISVIGKWYDLDPKLVDVVKKIVSKTKEYDAFFFNLFVNYDGQQEIVDATKLIAMQMQSGKLIAEAVTKETLKDNIYASYFIPPSLMIKTGMNHTIPNFLLWDLANVPIHFTDKYFPELKKSDIYKALATLQKE
jgi:undecaprenyl diphosphate synthase